MKTCACCNNIIGPERLKALPDTCICTPCAHRANVKRMKGAMIYSHKTAPTLQVMDADYFNEEWEKYQSKFGMGSAVHKVSPRMAGTK